MTVSTDLPANPTANPTGGVEKHPAAVAAMFSQLARRYDLVNAVVSFGQNYGWRRATTIAIDPQPGERILDLAGGTGSSAAPLARLGAEVAVCDISEGMMAVGRSRHPDIDFIAGDASSLPFADNSFAKATVTFGIRNMPDVPLALRELARVVRPGGKLVICEFSQPTGLLMSRVYPLYLRYILPIIAGVITRDKQAYTYFAKTIIEWPAPVEFARIITDNGWQRVGYRNLSGGIVALHRATK